MFFTYLLLPPTENVPKPYETRDDDEEEMKKSKKEQLAPVLIGHLNNIHDTLQLLDQTPSSTLDKGNWSEVTQMADRVSKQATIIGMLWTGETPDSKAVLDTMESYVNLLQGLLLLCLGSMVGAGPTLSSSIHASVKQTVDSSFKLLQGSVTLHDGSYDKDKNPPMPQLAGAVWEACSSFKRAPSSNISAIGRAISQVGVSVKDVLRELKEVKPAPCTEDVQGNTSVKPESGSDESGNSDVTDDLGNDLTPQEMEVAKMAIEVVSSTLAVIKELIRTISGLMKLEISKNNEQFVDSLEKLLKLCREIGEQIDELGACVYPPQELTTVKEALSRILRNNAEMLQEVQSFNVPSETFVQACNSLRISLEWMASQMKGSSTTTNDVIARIEDVALA